MGSYKAQGGGRLVEYSIVAFLVIALGVPAFAAVGKRVSASFRCMNANVDDPGSKTCAASIGASARQGAAPQRATSRPAPRRAPRLRPWPDPRSRRPHRRAPPPRPPRPRPQPSLRGR